MGLQNLANATSVGTMLRSNSVLVEIGGTVRRISLDNLMSALNEGNEQLLRQVAWGNEIKEYQSSTAWGPLLGNATMLAEYEAMSGRYMVSNSGYAAKVNPSGSALFMDGTSVVEARGHMMFWAPRLYFLLKVDSQTGKTFIWRSPLPIGTHYIEAPCFGAYNGSMDGTKLVSRSGVAPAGDKTISQFWAAAQENGVNWGLTNVEHRKFMLLKGLSKYSDTNIQAQLGYGVCGSTNLDLWATAATLLTGATRDMGDAYGKIDISVVNGANTGVSCSRVNLGGIEDPYGWQWEMIQGCYFGSSANSSGGQTGNEIFLYEGNRMPSAGELTSVPSGKYRKLTRLTAEGWIKSMLLGEYFDLFAKTTGGGNTSYWADYSYANATGQLLLWGGSASYGSFCGLGFSHSYNGFSSSTASFGARLAYYGDLKFVAGQQFMQLTA